MNNSNPTPKIIGILAVIMLVCCLCAASMVVCSAGVIMIRTRPTPTRIVRITRTPAPPITPEIVTPAPLKLQPPADLRRDPPPPEAYETWQLIESADIPERDLISVTLRLNDPGLPIPTVVRDSPWNFKTGDTRQFWVSNEDTHENFQVTARLVYETPHTYFWVEEGVKLNEKKLRQMADLFESKTYPTNREFFGSEWTPGVDSDPHLSILFARNMGNSVAGYYNSMDEFSQLVHEYSNEMEMFYINADDAQPGDPFYDCVLAHEFQHMIHWANDRNETNWINEGFAELACQLNGFGVGGSEYAFASEPDTQLTSWPDETGDAGGNYGAAYLFMAYFLDRFGEEATRALVADQANSITSVNQVLHKLGTGLTFEDVFADWLIANAINDPNLGDGRYGYLSIVPPRFRREADYRASSLPVKKRSDVRQYAADYIELRGPGDFQITFAGVTQVGLAPTTAHSGKYMWWGGRVDNSDTTLTREFNLKGLQTATLTFWTWYDIEKDFDYAYVEVSTDGRHWTTLPGQTTTNDDPNGANYGNGYTKTSGKWIQEKIDLTPYVGQKVQVRFEYLTDAGVTHAGIFIDDIAIPELNYYYDAEGGDDGWVARGFIRSAAILPQKWLLQLVRQSSNQTTIERLQLGTDNSGSWAVNLRTGEKALFIISGQTRITTEPAEYWYAITAPGQ